jgi:hypothetical protein
MKQLLLCTLLACSTGICSAQYFSFFQQENLFGWGPSSRTEALGQADVAIGGSVASIFRNPAGIGLIEKAEFDFTYSGPFYLLRKSDYFFTGAAYRIHDRFIAALSYNVFAMGLTSFGIDIEGTTYPVDKPVIGNIALSVAGEPVKDLHIGINLNLQHWKYIDEVKGSNTFHLDAGVLYTYHIGGDAETSRQGLRIGAGFNNVTKAVVKFSAPNGDKSDNNLPIVGRYGVTYFNEQLTGKLSKSGKSPIGMLATFEVQDLYNSDSRTAFRFGTEWTAYEIFSFRLGFYTISQDNMGIATNVSRQHAVTYGFGFIIPVDDISKGKVPMDLTFDYTSMNQPSYVQSSPFTSNMRSFGIRAIFSPDAFTKK